MLSFAIILTFCNIDYLMSFFDSESLNDDMRLANYRTFFIGALDVAFLVLWVFMS